MKNQRGVAKAPVLIIIGVIIVASVSGYLLFKSDQTKKSENTNTAAANQGNTNTLNNTDANTGPAGWNSYTHPSEAYSFRYPEGWEAFRIGTTDDTGVRPIGTTGDAQWGVFVYDGSNTTLADLIREDNPSGQRQERRESITVAGTTATKVTITYPNLTNWEQIGVFFKRQNKIYEITNGAIKDNQFTAFYESFTFSDPTAGWKTYTAPTANYQFKYPDGLGNADIRGGDYLGVLDGQVASQWEQNLMVVDTDRQTQVMYFYTPPQTAEPGTTLVNSIPNEWRDPSKYSKSTAVVNGITFDKYTAVNTVYSGVIEGYAATKSSRHYIISLQQNRLELATKILSTFQFSN